MNQNYKFKSLEIAKKGQGKEQSTKDPNAITVFETGDTRTIDFILKDGTRQCFLNSHMLTAWIGKDDDRNNGNLGNSGNDKIEESEGSENSKNNDATYTKNTIKNKRVIKIFFGTHLITIKGYCLDEIYNHLTTLSVKSIKANDERYLGMVKEDKAFVTDVKIEWKGEKDK